MADSPQHYGATPEEWEHFALNLGPEDLLPVVSNPNAKRSPKSKVTDFSKVPSDYNREGFARGFADWPRYKATDADIRKWMRQSDYGLCVQTRYVRAFDIDVPDPDLARGIAKAIRKHIVLPARVRPATGKSLYPFVMPGGVYPKRKIHVKGGIVEFLGDDNHFVACGTHKSGKRYQWTQVIGGGLTPALPEDIPEIKPELFETIWKELIDTFAIEPPAKEGKSSKRLDGEDNEAAMRTDPIAAFLENEGRMLSQNRDGSINIACPWKADHTTDNGDTETTYFPAGGRGYHQGHFKCLHAHCTDRSDDDFLNAMHYYLDQFEDVSTPEDKVKEETKRQRLQFMKVTHFARRKRLPWLIKGILPRGETMTFGASGSGKTFAILDMVCHLVLGIDWNGHKTKRSRCAYVCAEGAGGFIGRIQAWAQIHKVALTDLDDWLIITPDTPNFLKEEDARITAARIDDHFNGTCDFIVIDTLAQVTAGADENSAKDMGLALRHAKLLGVLTGAAYNLAHHTGKDEDKGPRGSTVMRGQLDAMFYIFRSEETRTFWIDKMKDGKDQFGYDFTLEDVTVGVDEDNDPIISCVTRYVGAAAGKREKKREPKRGRWQQTVMTAWEKTGGGNCVVENVIKAAMPSGTVENGKRDEYARNAMEALAQESIFTLRDGAVLIEDIDTVA